MSFFNHKNSRIEHTINITNNFLEFNKYRTFFKTLNNQENIVDS